MKKLSTIIVALLIGMTSMSLHAQRENPDLKPASREFKAMHERMLREKFVFLQRELALDDNQMREFWNFYLRYDNEISNCHERAKKTESELLRTSGESQERIDEDKINDETARILLEERVKTDRQLLEIDEKYSHEFTQVLSVQKILKLKRLEKQFMREFMSKNSNNRNKELKNNERRTPKEANQVRQDRRPKSKK